jgi:hypothetical protein
MERARYVHDAAKPISAALRIHCIALPLLRVTPRPKARHIKLVASRDANELKKQGSEMWKNDEAGIVCQALPRPRVYMLARFDAAAPTPASAARRNQSAAAG